MTKNKNEDCLEKEQKMEIETQVLDKTNEEKLEQIEQEKEFQNVVNEFCNEKTDKLDLKCLNKLSELDKRISKQNMEFNPCDKCLKFNNEAFTIYHHTFWQLNELKSETSMFYRRTIFLNIMSYLTTQNLCCTKFIFWKLKEFYYIFHHIL